MCLCGPDSYRDVFVYSSKKELFLDNLSVFDFIDTNLIKNHPPWPLKVASSIMAALK